MDDKETSTARSWTKKAITFGLALLFLTFALGMFERQYNKSKARTLWEPGAGYQVHASNPNHPVSKNFKTIQAWLTNSTTSDQTQSLSQDWSSYNMKDVFSDSVVDWAVAGASREESESSDSSDLNLDLWLKDDSEVQDVPAQTQDYPDTRGGDNTTKVGRFSSDSKGEYTCDKCCYRYTSIEDGITEILSQSELYERGCERRLPDAMIFGVKKGGTTTLKNFLSYHPDIAFTQKELKFFTSTDRKKGMEYYRSKMMYSTPQQISMEKTPAYSHYPSVPDMIKKALPNVKLIIIMRDPIERAISDFVHMQVTLAKKCNRLTTLNPANEKSSASNPDCYLRDSGYFVANTFRESITDSRGEINTTNLLVAKGVYVKDIQRYLKYFEPGQILPIDGEAFIHDPYPAVKQVEQFLSIREYFTPEHFYFDSQKGFFCMDKPIPKNCMKKSKGRHHPQVDEETLMKLREYYRPYNRALNQLMKVDFQWS